MERTLEYEIIHLDSLHHVIKLIRLGGLMSEVHVSVVKPMLIILPFYSVTRITDAALYSFSSLLW